MEKKSFINILLKNEKPSVYFNDLKLKSFHLNLMPELKALIGVPQSQFDGDAWDYTMSVVDTAARMKDLADDPKIYMLAVLCHGFGKPKVATEENDTGYEKAGIGPTRTFLKRLGIKKEEISDVCTLVEYHTKPNSMAFKATDDEMNQLWTCIGYPKELLLLAKIDAVGAKLDTMESEYQATEDWLIASLKNYRKHCKTKG